MSSRFTERAQVRFCKIMPGKNGEMLCRKSRKLRGWQRTGCWPSRCLRERAHDLEVLRCYCHRSRPGLVSAEVENWHPECESDVDEVVEGLVHRDVFGLLAGADAVLDGPREGAEAVQDDVESDPAILGSGSSELLNVKDVQALARSSNADVLLERRHGDAALRRDDVEVLQDRVMGDTCPITLVDFDEDEVEGCLAGNAICLIYSMGKRRQVRTLTRARARSPERRRLSS